MVVNLRCESIERKRERMIYFKRTRESMGVFVIKEENGKSKLSLS